MYMMCMHMQLVYVSTCLIIDLQLSGTYLREYVEVSDVGNSHSEVVCLEGGRETGQVQERVEHLRG